MHRNELVVTKKTRYFILDEETAPTTLRLPAGHPYYESKSTTVGPGVWWMQWNRNQSLKAFYLPDHHECGKIMVRPTKKMTQSLEKLYKATGSISEDVTNFIDDTLEVEFVYNVPTNATELHPYTGNIPFWHPLGCGASTMRMGDIKTEQEFLHRHR